MVELASKHLLFHGPVVLLAGLLSGIPMGTAIINNRGEVTVRAWRVAHSGLAMVGTCEGLQRLWLVHGNATS